MQFAIEFDHSFGERFFGIEVRFESALDPKEGRLFLKTFK